MFSHTYSNNKLYITKSHYTKVLGSNNVNINENVLIDMS